MLAWCAEQGLAAIPYGGGTSVVGGVEPRVGDAYAGRGHDRPRRASTACSRWTRSPAPRGSRPAPRARARGPAPRARADAAPLPAVVRVLHAGRLDRDPGGRPLRDALHAHRRPGRVGAGDDPRRRLGEPPAAGLGRRPQPRPPAARLRGDPRGDHRGLGAGPGASPLEALGRGRLRLVRAPAPRRSASSRSPGLNPSNCRLLDPAESALTHAGPPGKALLVLGFESAHHPVDGRWRSRSRRRATTAASPARSRGARRRRSRAGRAFARTRQRRARPGRPGRRLAARLPRRAVPARHLRRLRRPLATRSRPRSPGTASASSTPR